MGALPAQGARRLEQILEGLAALYVLGVAVDWAGFDRDYVRRRVVLPTYPFQRQRYWIDVEAGPRAVPPVASSEGYRQWLCTLEWHRAPREPAATSNSTATWLVCGTEGGSAPALVAALRARGARAVFAATGPEMARTVNEATGAGPLAGIVHLLDIDPSDAVDPLETQRKVIGSALPLAQSLAGSAVPASLWLVTRGAQAAAGRLTNVDEASLWGLGRALLVEQPGLRCVCVDLDPDRSEMDGLVDEMLSPKGPENQIAFRGGERYVARLSKSRPLGSPEPPTLELRSDATYLVTGGLRGLGLEVAKWLAERGARHLVLMGRRPPSPETLAAIRALEANGARTLALAVDVADLAALRSAFAQVDAAMPPLRGLVHCAGELDDALLADQTWPRFARVMGPKIKGAANLDALTRERALDFFVLFSSSASLLGSPGQANYAAANAWMDALAHRRRGQGLPATAINWGAWGEVGMAARLDEAHRRRQTGWGSGTIPVQEGLKALGHLMAIEATQAAVLPIDWPTLLGLLPEPPRFLAAMGVDASATSAGKAPAPHDGPLAGLEGASPEDRRTILETFVRQQVVKVLALDTAHPPGLADDFRESGMDSLMATDLRNRLQTGLGRSLPPTVALEHSTIGTLAAFLAEVWTKTLPAAASSTWAAANELGETDPQLLAAMRARGVEAAVDDLSGAEVDRLLAEMTRKSSE